MFRNNVYRQALSCLCASLVFASLVGEVRLYAAGPGGGLPPFVPVPAPVKTLQPVSPFTITGFMQSATVDAPGDILSGGSVIVNGITITVPKNTLMQMPAMALTWEELFALAPRGTAPAGLGCASGPLPCSTGSTAAGQTGLALNDSPAPSTTYEITVMGNRLADSTGDRYIAGLMFLSQQSLNTGQGYINYIDYQNGELWVSSTLGGKAGARVRINTPSGRYGLAQSPDQRFAADEDNPTIRASTGYPMCIPRFDPSIAADALCPEWNRPVDPVTGAYQTIYTMPPPPAVSPTPTATGPMPLPDANQQAPFEVNDYITYAGTLVKDSAGMYISAHTITAALGIFTYPGAMPAYVAIDSLLLGVGGNPNPLFPQEAVEKLVIDAFTTDPTQLVDFYAVDVDACGTRSNRYYGAADPSGPPAAGVKGRARIRTTVGSFLPATREIRAASRTMTGGNYVDAVLPTAKTYANGLVAGQYQAPNFTFIFPENLVLGSPQVPLPLQEFPFLVNGSGPYHGAGSNTSALTSYGNIGQLSPWPGASVPPPNACGTNGVVLTPPIANAGAAQTVPGGKVATLDASGSSDTNNPALALSYTWVQSGGPSVTLQDAGMVKPYFAAPTPAAGSSPVVLTFSLAVSNGFASSSVATTTVTVTPAAPPASPQVNAGANQTVSSQSQVHLNGTASDPGGSTLVYKWTQTAGAAVSIDNTASLSPTFLAPTMVSGQPAQTLTFQLTATNSSGVSGSATTTVTVSPIGDAVQITSAVYHLSKSRMDVTATSSITNGQPVLTLHIPNKPDVQMTFDPRALTYSATGVTTNPIPGSVSVTSSFGGSAVAPVTQIKQ